MLKTKTKTKKKNKIKIKKYKKQSILPTTNATIYFLKQAMKIEKKNGSSIYRKDKKENTGVFPLFLIHTCNKSSVAISLLKEVSTEILPILYRIRHLTFFQLVLIS